MNKLYAPYIASILPAQAGSTLAITYTNHQTILDADYDSMVLLIKDGLYGDQNLGTIVAQWSNLSNMNQIDKTECIATFKISDFVRANSEVSNNPFVIGQYYKVFLAYRKEGQIGYYSTAGVFKYTDKPTLDVSLDNEFGAHVEYTVPSTDPQEKLYSLKYYLYNTQDKTNPILVDSSEEQIINYANRENLSSIEEEYYFNFQFNLNIYSYSVVVEYKTINNYVNKTTKVERCFPYVQSDKFIVNVNKDYFNEDYLTKSYNHGINYIYFTFNDSARSTLPPYVVQSYLASGGKLYEIIAHDEHIETVQTDNVTQYHIKNYNASSPTDFNRFICVRKNLYSGEYATIVKFNSFDSTIKCDLSTEHGVKYQYILFFGFKDSDILYYNVSDECIADFEDIIIYDSQRLLRLRFNPEVTSFKTSIPMSKQETIGGSFPIIYQNGNVAYKEFSIKSLLSYLSDEAMYFVSGLPDGSYNGLKENLGIAWGPNDYRVNTNLALSYEAQKEDVISDIKELLQSYGYTVRVLKYNIIQYYDLSTSEAVVKQTLEEELSASDLELLNRYENTLNAICRALEEIKTIMQPKSFYPSVSQDCNNVFLERQFRMAVLDWFNNNEPKVFKSPTEGNYIIKLMSVTLTPKKEIGRLLSEVSANAVEVMQYTHDNLIKYDLVLLQDPVTEE